MSQSLASKVQRLFDGLALNAQFKKSRTQRQFAVVADTRLLR